MTSRDPVTINRGASMKKRRSAHQLNASFFVHWLYLFRNAGKVTMGVPSQTAVLNSASVFAMIDQMSFSVWRLPSKTGARNVSAALMFIRSR